MLRQADQPIRLQYSQQIRLFSCKLKTCYVICKLVNLRLFNILGQENELQASISESTPGHGAPSYKGSIQVLERFREPYPHVAEQSDQLSHDIQTPSTVNIKHMTYLNIVLSDLFKYTNYSNFCV